MLVAPRFGRQEVRLLHDQTSFDDSADDLLGASVNTESHQGALVWFSVGGSYNGTVHFEASPDGGVRWFPIYTEPLSDPSTGLTSATPTEDELYITPLPHIMEYRVRMEGGTQGSLTVHARFIPDYGGGR